MISEGLSKAGEAANAKVQRLRKDFLGYLVLSLFAGFYIGSAMFIAVVIGARTPEAPDKFLMGLGFSVGLLFVVFAGAELFTGNVLTMGLAGLTRKAKLGDILLVLSVSYIGNLAGGWLTALVVNATGLVGGAVGNYLGDLAYAKVALTFTQSFSRAVLCNLFVTLGVWMSWLAKTEGAKIALIVAAVFAFVVCGYEHVVANAFLLPVAVLANAGVTIEDYVGNMGVVGLGNLVGGLVLAVGYWAAGKKK